MGDSKNINIWTEPWVPFKNRHLKIFGSQPFHGLTKVKDLIILGTNRWDRTLLKSIFTPTHIKEIKSVQTSPIAQAESLRWGATKTRIFTVKSQYKILSNQASPDASDQHTTPEKIYKTLWHCKGKPKYKAFFCKYMVDIAPSKERLHRIFKDINTHCPFCQDQETTQHMLLACPFSKAVWYDLTGYKLDSFKN